MTFEIIDWIGIGLLAAGIITVIVLLVRKWDKIRRLDLEAMPKAKLRNKKFQIIEDRFLRKTKGIREATKRAVAPAGSKLSQGFGNVRKKLGDLEKKYREGGGQPKTQEEKEMSRQKVSSLIDQGVQLFKEEKYAEAEETFLDIIRINPKEVEAYEYLGEVYFEKKEYDHAVETLEFAKTLNPNDDRIYFDLGRVYQQTAEYDQAMEMFKRCVELAPKNPRNLNGLLQLAIEAKDGFVATRALKSLKEVNPENQKLEELEAQVEELGEK